MNPIIADQLEAYPKFLTSNDLVNLGLFRSSDLAYLARRKGKSPDYVKFGRKVLYPKSCVIDFIQTRFKKGDAATIVSNEANHAESSSIPNRIP